MLACMCVYCLFDMVYVCAHMPVVCTYDVHMLAHKCTCLHMYVLAYVVIAQEKSEFEDAEAEMKALNPYIASIHESEF